MAGSFGGRYFEDIKAPFGAFMIGPPVDLLQERPVGLFLFPRGTVKVFFQHH